jgi:Flp pilus assembly protein TadG
MTPESDPRARGRCSGRGQSLVEFALVIPIMLLLLAGAIDLGRLFYAYVAVENAAKEGAFFGSRSPLCDDASTAGCSNPNNVIWHVQNEATNIGGQFATTVACRTPGGALVQPINDCLDGYTYQVTVSYPFRLLTPILGSIVNQNLTLSAESQATVISDAFDPSGLEVLVWASSTGADNIAAISTACTQADATNAPTYYYAPCQDATNVNNFLVYPENTTVSYKVRVRNTGNLALTGVAYTWSANGTGIAAQGDCGSLPTSIGAGAAPSFCTFTRSVPAVNPVNGFADYTMAVTAQGVAGGLSTSLSNGAATVRVVPAPKLAVNLKASPYRLGGIGYGTSGSPTFPSGPLTLQRNASATQAELLSPTGWLYLTVVNQGSPANAFTVTVTRNGVVVSLPCTVPASLAASGQSGSSFSCTLPQTFTANGLATFVATASATNAVIVAGQQPSVAVTAASSCNGNNRVVPNLVDTLTPTADGTNKTILQARTLWTAAAFTTTVATNPAGAANTLTAFTQNVTAYTCANRNSGVTVVAQ